MGVRSHLNRILAVCFVVAVSAFAPLALAQEELPQEDPSREWRGREYADSVAAQYYLENPQGRLTMDLKVLPGFAGGEQNSGLFNPQLKQHVSEGRKTVEANIRGKNGDLKTILATLVKKSFHPEIERILSQLEYGEEISLEMSDSKLKDLEEKLKSWILRQKEASVYPHQLMAKALGLTNGEMISAWVIAWNVTREEWISAQVRNYGELTNKFASLTGEKHLWQGAGRYLPNQNQVPEAIPGSKIKPSSVLDFAISKRGDEFSYLYHRIGVELFAMITSRLSGSSFVGSLFGKLGAVGEFIKYTQTAGMRIEAKKRVGNDLKAADSGARLYKFVRSGLKPSGDLARADHYLRSNTAKFNSAYQIQDSRPPHFYRTSYDESHWTGPMSMDEMIRVFYHAVFVDLSSLNPILLDANGDLERLMRGLANYEQLKLKNNQLDSLLREWQKQRGSDRVFYYEPGVKDFSLEPGLALSFVKEFRDKDSYLEIKERIHRQIDRALAATAGSPLRCGGLFMSGQ